MKSTFMNAHMSVAMSRARLLIYSLLPLTCFLVFVWPPYRVSNWYLGGEGMGLAPAAALWLGTTAAMVYSFSAPRLLVRFIMVHWMGVSFILLTLVLLYEVLRLVLPVSDRLAAQWIVAAAAVLVIGAVIAAHFLGVRYLGIHSGKVNKARRIVQISDIHIGSRQGGYLRRIVKRINRLGPDVVVITGDLVDTAAVGEAELRSLRQLQSRTLFSIGNHERYADLQAILDLLIELGVEPLRQQAVEIDGIQFLGIDDADDPRQVENMLPTIEMEKGPYTVLLYHRPLGWEAAIEHGIDLMLSGHTHNGQIFPFNLVVKRQFRHIHGMYIRGKHRLYVSPGTGTWGPFMRLGSLNEVTCIDLKPEP